MVLGDSTNTDHRGISASMNIFAVWPLYVHTPDERLPAAEPSSEPRSKLKEGGCLPRLLPALSGISKALAPDDNDDEYTTLYMVLNRFLVFTTDHRRCDVRVDTVAGSPGRRVAASPSQLQQSAPDTTEGPALVDIAVSALHGPTGDPGYGSASGVLTIAN